MYILITYDVATVDRAGARRLRRIARACCDYGQRVQNSVFECRLSSVHWIALRDRILNEMCRESDSVRFYYLDSDISIEHHGIKGAIDLEGPLVI